MEKYVWAYFSGMLVKMSQEKTIVGFFFQVKMPRLVCCLLQIFLEAILWAAVDTYFCGKNSALLAFGTIFSLGFFTDIEIRQTKLKNLWKSEGKNWRLRRYGEYQEVMIYIECTSNHQSWAFIMCTVYFILSFICFCSMLTEAIKVALNISFVIVWLSRFV